jgi:hypothetical protein
MEIWQAMHCTVARSSTEVEYKALTDGTAEVLWFCYLLKDFFFPVLLPPFGATMWVLRICLLILSFMHVQSMLRLIITLFEIYRVAEKKIHIRFKSSEDQLVDVLTKSLPHTAFAYLRSKLHVVNPPSA